MVSNLLQSEMESTLLFMIGLTSVSSHIGQNSKQFSIKIKKASNIFKIGVQFLSGWCKSAIKGFDVLKYWAE
ncbi:hypothetical protein ACLGD5_05960 [Helicobacter pylori]